MRLFYWGLIVSLVFFFVWQQIQSVRLGYDLASIRRTVQLQRERNAYLRLSLERTLSPEWISEVAKTRLGMHPSNPENLIILEAQNANLRPGERLRSFVQAVRAREHAKPETLISRVFAISAVR